MGDMLSEALNYAKRGWYVFPCREKPGAPFTRNNEQVIPQEKTPYVAKGLLDATKDEDQIRAWWSKWQDAMIGVNAGMSGLFVVDIDKKTVNGLDTFSSWNINDSAGLHSITPSGGMHIVFTGKGKSSTNANTGIDTRGEGGYFIAPPSKIIEGDYSGEYRFFDDWGRTPGVIPDGLMGNLFPDTTIEYVRGNYQAPDGVTKQLSRPTLTFLADGASEGERNSTLFKVLADFAGCGYSPEHARESVLPVATRIGLSGGEFETVLEHAYSKPRTASIPDSIQEKLLGNDKDIAKNITIEEQAIIEEALFACLIVDNKLIPVVQDILYFEDFQNFKNRVIFKSISSLYNSGVTVDYITLSNEVAKESDKISLGHISDILNQYFIDTASAVNYANIIREKSAIRKVEALMDNKDKYIRSGNINTIVTKLEEDVSDIAIYAGARSTNILNARQAVSVLVERTRKIMNGEIVPLKIGFSEYDKHIGGLYSDEFVMCAGRAGEGKSALVLSIANHVGIVDHKGVLFFTLEMSTIETICRLIAQLTGLRFQDIYEGKLDEREWIQYDEAIEKIKNSKIYFDESAGITVPELRSKIRKTMEKGLSLVIIDQLEQVKGYENLKENVRLDRIAYDIKNFTKEFNVPVILNHQLNRNTTIRGLKNPEPKLSDLNQAGEKAPTQVWMIYHQTDKVTGEIEKSKIKIVKNRNAPKMDFRVIFLGERMLFSNPATEADKQLFYGGKNNDNDYEDGHFDPNAKPFWDDDSD